MTPTIITAHKLWANFCARGVRLSVQWVREGDGTHWPRVWMRGGKQSPGDFESIARVKTELVTLLEAARALEGTTLDNCDYALTRGFAPPLPLPLSSLLEELSRGHIPPRRTPYGNKGRPRNPLLTHSQRQKSENLN